ncbi:MAG TPA: HEAT repeat domain-containing protein, partial [Spirochaetota bacterium]|nr:HEAT repeat domain-containing protein [Spirochaetota bacterium]
KMSVEELGERLLYSENPFVRIHSAVAIGMKREKSGLLYLEKKLYDEELDVRKAVIWALGNLKMKKSVSLLKKMFYEGDSIIRSSILKSIEYLTDSKGAVFEKMLDFSLNSKIDEVRLYALEVAIKNKKSQNFDSLVNIFKKIKNVNDNRILSYNGG